MARRYDLVIIGMGSGGMPAAEFAAHLGLRVAVVERGRVGGDCLWTGCVPSKTLLASAKMAHHVRHADHWGLPARPDLEVDTSLVWKRIRAVQDQIAATDDSPERFASLGVELISGKARVAGPRAVEVEGRVLSARYILLCTGSRPATLPIAGLDEAGYLTSENIWELDRAPASVVALGAGPISLELAQGLTRLGVKVTVLEKFARALPRDEPALVGMLLDRLREEGVDVRFEVDVERVELEDGRKVVHGTERGVPARWAAEDVLVGVGRRPNVEDLGLEAAGVRVGPKGVEVDDRMRSSVPSIYAAGDVAGRFLFTHSAAHEALRAVRDMFYPGKGTVSDLVPWCTFTDPELAHAGQTEAEARDEHGEGVRVWQADLAHSDRARAEGQVLGRIIAVSGRKGNLLGAHVLAPNAGELIHELALVIRQGGRLAEVSSLIHVYPTWSTTVAQVAADATFEMARRYRWLTWPARLRPW
ncbi:MAG: FAD-dependent oxidoreductase [Actinomycetota bacterium]|nr:FAD-dependent oxidoreductase [Actinomycetota bacterium]PLS76717.1 MAG: pyridine nucleotide-disulfide oxidoreductase [Actinomycetota bacterium]